MKTFNYNLEIGDFDDQSQNLGIFLKTEDIFNAIIDFISTNIDLEHSWMGPNGQLYLRDNWFYKDGSHYLDIYLRPGEIEYRTFEDGDTQDDIQIFVDIIIKEYAEDIALLQ